MLLVTPCGCGDVSSLNRADDASIVYYDRTLYPHLQCLAGRVIAETDPALTAADRAALWQSYGLKLGYEWVVPESGFTYHELEVLPHTPISYLKYLVTHKPLPPRELRPLVDLLNDDPRIHWAAPDALVLEWCDDAPPAPPPIGREMVASAASERYGVSLLSERYSMFMGSVDEWAALEGAADPFPDFEYYRMCDPQGTAVPWVDELKQNETFMSRCRLVYGTGQERALAAYQAQGAPKLAPITVCVADTGMFLNHPDFAGRLHPNAIDANFRNFRVAAPDERAAADVTIDDRYADIATGLPREAIKGQPAAHGTCVGGIVARCTAGFDTSAGPIRLLPVSLKSHRTMTFSGLSIKSPISSAVKLLGCLNLYFPVGDFIPDPDDPVQNTGDVRVVTVSASVPKAYFSDAEWQIVSNLVGKAAGSVAEDLRVNDRVYLFAAGNTMQGAPDKPGEMDYVIAVTATMPYDPRRPWEYPPSNEGANLGMKCVAAPGFGIITSTLYAHPNLEYLPEEEIPRELPNFSTPRREVSWTMHSNHFAATSAATPQVASLAALLIAQDPTRDYRAVISIIEESTAGRIVEATRGKARGLVDYTRALGWGYTPPAL